jgi:cytochrome c oxidase subunit 1
VGSLLFGRRVPGSTFAARPTPVPRAPVAAAISGHGSAATFAAPGTFTLALVFLVAFVLYYFINWKYLSTVWGLS